MSFQEKLRYYREKAGYKSAKEFANLLGVPYTTYVAYENKGREPRYDTLKKISFLLEVSIDTLLENKASEVQEALKDLRQCGITVDKDSKKSMDDSYCVQWGEIRVYEIEHLKVALHDFHLLLNGSDLITLYNSVNESEKKFQNLLKEFKKMSYEKRLTEIHLKKSEAGRKYLFINEAGYREKLAKEYPDSYKRLYELYGSEIKK